MMPINIESVGVPCVRVGASLVTRTIRFIVLTMIVSLTVLTSAFIQAPLQVLTLILCVSVVIWILTPWEFSKWIFLGCLTPISWAMGWFSYAGKQSALGVLRFMYWYVVGTYGGLVQAFSRRFHYLYLELYAPDRTMYPIPFGGERDNSSSGYYPWYQTAPFKVVNITVDPVIKVSEIPPISTQLIDYWSSLMLAIPYMAILKSVTLLVSLAIIVYVLWGFLESFLIRKRRESMERDLFESESAVPGSPFMVSNTKPTFQASVWVKIDGRWKFSGEGFRCDKYFVTAAHVLMGKDIRIVSQAATVEVLLEQFEIMSVDIAVLLLTPQVVSKLSLTSARFGPSVEQKFMAEVYAGGYKTIGFVEQFDAFGYVRYSGSTKHGFSGAPYVTGKSLVVGMHLASSGANVGYDGAFIDALIRKLNESSEDWLLDQVKAGFVKKLRFQQSPVSPDEYMVKVRGKYILCDSDTMNDLTAYGVFPDEQGGMGFEARDLENAVPAQWAKKSPADYSALVEDEAKPKMPFNLQLQDQGNSLRPSAASAGATGISLETPPLVVLRQREQSSLVTESLSAPTPVTEPPVSTHVPRNVPSDSTPIESILLGHLSKMTTKEKKSLLRLLDASLLGDSPSTIPTKGGSKSRSTVR